MHEKNNGLAWDCKKLLFLTAISPLFHVLSSFLREEGLVWGRKWLEVSRGTDETGVVPSRYLNYFPAIFFDSSHSATILCTHPILSVVDMIEEAVEVAKAESELTVSVLESTPSEADVDKSDASGSTENSENDHLTPGNHHTFCDRKIANCEQQPPRRKPLRQMLKMPLKRYLSMRPRLRWTKGCQRPSSL